MMQKCLATQIGKNVQVYIDDVVITSKKGSTLIEDLKETFDNLDKFCLKLNPTKCSFGVPAGELLGFLVSARGIEANPEKIQAIVTMRKPTKLKEVQQLTGESQCSSPPRSRRSSSAAARLSFAARRTYAAPPPDLVVRRASAASSSSALHSCFFLTFTASPSAELVGDRRSVPSPEKVFLNDCDARDFYKLQPHHLPGNSIFYLSCYTTFMEAYIGIRPTRETFARFFALRINSVQGVDIPAPKPRTFFYVKNNGAADLICLPPFDPAPPAKTNWSYNPKEAHNETNRIIRFMRQKMKDTGICSDDIVRTFISRRVLPLKRRAHRMSEMYGPGDPTKITGLPLSKKDVVLKAKQICQTAMPFNWEWGLLPFSTTNPPTQEEFKRALDSFDPDPYIFWKDLKMGKTPASRLGRSPPKPTGSSDDLVMLEIHEHVPPLRAEAGSEFVDKLMAQGQKNKRPPALKLGPRPSESEARSGRAAPSSSDHRTEEDLSFFPENQDTGTSNIGAGEENVAGQAEPPAPPVLEKKTTSAPESSAPEGSKPGGAPTAPPSPRTILMPPPSAPSAQPSGPYARRRPGFRLTKGKRGSQRLFAAGGLWCCTSPRPPRILSPRPPVFLAYH
ncbi:hypothetical protein QYE76_029415 [Lolium multiflorum]|uniref:Reverse transcriptase domain-containing protein n=1 Tax=Lolium multiflorum TaxID=4521 RepID=A0AAD8QQE3_LOLMU|nr:hypothetical protein QYE76_029415 [Lolium multiflorum]